MRKDRREFLSALTAVAIAGCGQRETLRDDAVSRTITTPRLTILHRFNQRSGCVPFCGLTHSDALGLLGTTHRGGILDAGVLYRYDFTTSAYEVLHSFGDFDGKQPFSDLTIHNATVYGVTKFGGLDDKGTIFSWSPTSGFETLHHFSAGKSAAQMPHAGPIFHQGSLFGTTFHGGSRNGGTVYRFGLLDRQFDVLAELTEDSGQFPTCRPVLLSDSEASGTSADSLLISCCDLGREKHDEHGSLVRVTLDTGATEVLHRFRGGRHGGHPYDVPLHVGNGVLVGTALGRFGDPKDTGVLYELDLQTKEFQVHQNFKEESMLGIKPNGSLSRVADTNQLVGITHGHQANPGIAGGLFVFDTDKATLTRQHIFQDPQQGWMPTRTPIVIDRTVYGTCCFGGLAPTQEFPQGQGVIYSFDLDRHGGV
jgi:uncharacterized repeat protein (TIGR03803 family)